MNSFDLFGLRTAGGFSGNVGHDPHLLYTLSAVQILVMFDSLDKIDTAKVAACTCNRMHKREGRGRGLCASLTAFDCALQM